MKKVDDVWEFTYSFETEIVLSVASPSLLLLVLIEQLSSRFLTDG
jgi:hypothetical protein